MSVTLPMSDQKLSRAEQAVYNLMILGLSNIAMAEKLFVTEKTIKFHTTTIFRKCGCKTRVELIAKHYQKIIQGLTARLASFEAQHV